MLYDTNVSINLESETPLARATAPRLGHNAPVHASLPHAAFGIMGAAFGATVVAYTLTFGSTAEGAIAMAVCAFYLIMYLGTPYILARIGGPELRIRHGGEAAPALRHFLRGAIETAAGRTSGWSALTQVTLVPVGMALASIGMCVAVVAAR